MKFTRRSFLQYSFLTAAAAALSGCGRPVEHGLLSQYQMPEYVLPGMPVYYATSCGLEGVAVKTVEGRAIKIEGLPGHPISQGKVSAQTQAALTTLYHPERLTQPLKKGAQATWDAVLGELGETLKAMEQSRALFIVDRLQGLHGTNLLALAASLNAKIWVCQYPNTETERSVLKGLVGKAELPYYALEQADYVVNFGSDFLVTSPLAVRYGWAYGQFRQGRDRHRGVMVAVSSRMNLTCANADRWLPVAPGTEGWIAAAVGNLLGRTRTGWPDWMAAATPEKASEVTGVPKDLIERLAARLSEARKPLIVAGPDGSSDAASLYAMHALGKLVGGVVQTCEPDRYHDDPMMSPDSLPLVSTSEALDGLSQGRFQAVMVVDCNPAYLVPGLAENLRKVPQRVAFSQFANETTALCDLVLPSRTWLEEWRDCIADGPFGRVWNFSQPVVRPRVDARSVMDVLMTAARTAQVGSAPAFPSYLSFIQTLVGKLYGPQAWDQGVARGGLWEPADRSWEPYAAVPLAPPPAAATEVSPPKVPLGSPWSKLPAAPVGAWPEPPPPPQGKLAVIPFVNVNLGDGSLTNSPWMQEIPDPMTTVMWSSWIEINPMSDVARKLDIKRGDVIQLKLDNGSVLEGPAYPTPAIHKDAVGIAVGQGHDQKYSRYTSKIAHPMNPLTAGPAQGLGWASVSKTGKVQFMATRDRRIMGLHTATLPHD
ncbi:MAG: hypothetical protein AB1758_10150 [Candidatus Eremiobacterota bacterium]